MTPEVFVYYRVRLNQGEPAQDLARAFQARLQARHPYLKARLMQRADAGPGPQTWMEHYATDPLLAPQGITPALQAEIEVEAEALRSCIDGPRHTEVFVACVS
jgi:hypothetical protein